MSVYILTYTVQQEIFKHRLHDYSTLLQFVLNFFAAVSNLTSLVPAANVTSSSEEVSCNLTLSYTVTGDGKFSWSWTSPQTLTMKWRQANFSMFLCHSFLPQNLSYLIMF